MWFFRSSKNWIKEIEEKAERGFSVVKEDMGKVGKWIKHLDDKNKQVFDVVSMIKDDLASIRNEIYSLRDAVEIVSEEQKGKQVFKKLPVLGKQTAVEGVEEAVQTAVQNLF